jgi:hypothetical protein
MGWDSCNSWMIKKHVIDDLRNNIKRSNWNILAEKNNKDGIWFVIERESEKEIYFGLIKKERGEYCLKTMSENMGPSYSCPVSLFKHCEAKTEIAINWRKKCLEIDESNKRRKGRKLEIYMRIKLYDITYTVINPLLMIVSDNEGRKFKLIKSQMNQWEEVINGTI